MNLLFFLTPKQDVLFIYEDFTLRQTLEKWSNQRFATIPVLKSKGEYLGTMTEGDILWGIKSIHGLDIDASEDIPIAMQSARARKLPLYDEGSVAEVYPLFWRAEK